MLAERRIVALDKLALRDGALLVCTEHDGTRFGVLEADLAAADPRVRRLVRPQNIAAFRLSDFLVQTIAWQRVFASDESGSLIVYRNEWPAVEGLLTKIAPRLDTFATAEQDAFVSSKPPVVCSVRLGGADVSLYVGGTDKSLRAVEKAIGRDLDRL